MVLMMKPIWSQEFKSFDKWTPKMERALNDILTIKPTLHPMLFTRDEEPKNDLKKYALKVGHFFLNKSKLPKGSLKDIRLVGSMMGYGYTEDSDIDVQLIFDLKEIKCNQALRKAYLSRLITSNWRLYHLQFLGYPVQVTPKTLNDTLYGGYYSVLKNKWIRKPNRVHPIYKKEEVKKNAIKFMHIYHEIKKAYLLSPQKNKCSQIVQFKKSLRKYRSDALSSAEGNLSLGDLTYRLLYHVGLQKDLYKLEMGCYDNYLSLAR